MGKGEDFERNMCKYLSFWWTNGESDKVFWRNRIRYTKGKQRGDITGMVGDAHRFSDKINLEIKKEEGSREKIQKIEKDGTIKQAKRKKKNVWDVLYIIDSKKFGNNILIKYWDQTFDDAINSNRFPMLLFARDNHDPVICISAGFLSELLYMFGAYENNLIKVMLDDNVNLVCLNMHEFFKWITPDGFKSSFKD